MRNHAYPRTLPSTCSHVFAPKHTHTQVRLLFKLYDLTGDGYVGLGELKTMLYSLVAMPSLLPGFACDSSSMDIKTFRKFDQAKKVCCSVRAVQYLPSALWCLLCVVCCIL